MKPVASTPTPSLSGAMPIRASSQSTTQTSRPVADGFRNAYSFDFNADGTRLLLFLATNSRKVRP